MRRPCSLLSSWLARAGASLTLATIAAGSEFTATTTWQDNATNAERSSDRLSAWEMVAKGSLDSHRSLSHDVTLLYAARGSAELWPEYHGLSQLTIGPALTLQHKFGLGAFAPQLRVEVVGEAIFVRESERSGWAGDASLRYEQRASETTSVNVGITQSHLAARSAVFARTGTEAFAEIRHDLDERWQLDFSVHWRSGDIVSYARPPRPDLLARARSARAVTTFDTPQVAYRLDAHTWSYAVGISPALNAQTSLNFQIERRETTSGPIRYVNHLVSVSWVHQF